MTAFVSATELAAQVKARTLSAADAAQSALDRIAAIDPKLHAFLEIFPERALDQARAIDTRLAAGDNPGPLAGVPIALKDNICLAWGKTTAASRFLGNYESPFTATAAQRLINAGAVIIGKTNLDEFAMGSSTEHSAFGPTKNPWDITRVPGGSSGGSAAAVAARCIPLALGSDTGGSIRQPAAHCGIIGLKPTYGRISRYGLIAFASSLDQIGPMTTTVADAALALSVMAGIDPLDATSADRYTPDFLAELEDPVEDLTIGVPRQARSAANDPAVASALEHAARTFASRGATIVDVDLPTLDDSIAAYYIVAPAEASSNLARYDGVRFGRRAAAEAPNGAMTLDDLYTRSRSEGFGPEVQRRIMLGTHVLSSGYYDAYYLTALKARRRVKADFDGAFGGLNSRGSGCHAILMPASPGPAFALGAKLNDPLAMYLEDIYTVSVNLAGLPAISMPAGFSDVGGTALPIGMQLIGPAFDEARLLRIARQFELATDFSGKTPSL